MKKNRSGIQGAFMDSATTLASLAMLKVKIDSGKDYLEYLRPYVVHVLQTTQLEPVSDIPVAVGLREICGLEIPHRTVNIILQRLAKDGHLTRENGLYKINRLPQSNFEADRADSLRQLDYVATELTKFARVVAEREITVVEATDSIVAFLSQFSIPCLKSFLRGTALPRFAEEADWQIVLVGQFVHQMSDKPHLFQSFMRFVEGHMLANALLCPDLNQVSNTYDSVTFYLDTPILIKLLGLEGVEEQQAVEELIRLVHRLKGKTNYFSHTHDELVATIQISASYIDSPKARGSIVAAALKLKRSKSDLLLVAENASAKLESYGVICTPSPAYDQATHRFEIGEEAFAKILNEEISYYNPRARENDIRSVRSIYVLRKGLNPHSVEKSKAVFVTSNVSFSKAAYEYGKKHEQSREVSTVITDFSLANTAWLKAPHGASLLPQKEVLALAYAAIQPTTEFWARVLEEADKLQANGEISPRDHQLLRSSQHVQDELMKLTLGSEESLTRESITKTVQRVTDEIRQEDAVRLKSISEANAVLERQLAEQTAQVKTIIEKIYWAADAMAQREAKWGARGIWGLQILISIVSVVAFYFKPDSFWWWSVLFLVGFGTSILRLAGTRWDLKPIKAKPAYIEWRRAKLIEKQTRLLSLPEDLVTTIAG